MEQKNTGELTKQFVNVIVQDLSSLNGTEFEDLCRTLLSMILNEKVLHKGCNLNGKPVPYAVDVKSEDCKIVGQSGTDTDYFTKNDLEKPMSDISGTKRNNPLCEVLYLFSNQRASDAQHTGLVSKINVESPSFDVKIYDAEKIAETILDNINNPRCNDVWKYLPEGYQYYAIFPKKNCIPQSSLHYVARLQESKEVQAILKTQSIVEVVGVSGIGKSEFAKQLAKDISQNFETIFWIDGTDYDGLDSVKLCQFAYDVNLRFVLQEYKCLIIVDNMNEKVVAFCEQYNTANKHDSKCIITTLKQQLPDEQTYKLPYMLEELVTNVIDSFELQISDADRTKLINLTAGYPLAVTMICSMLKDKVFSLQDILEDGALQELEDDRNKRLSERIIGKIYERYKEDLNLLAYMNSLTIASEYIGSAIGKIHLKYLLEYSILQQTDAYSYKLHQVILDAIKYFHQQPNLSNVTEKLTDYLDKKNRLKDIHFFTLFHNNGTYIDKIYKEPDTTEEQRKIILYSQLQAAGTFNNANKYIALLNHLSLHPAEFLYDCLLFAEQNEIELSTTSKGEFKEKAKVMITKMNEVLEQASKEDIKFELLHHIGKLYMKVRDNERAKEFFLKALKLRPMAFATLLQLAKSYHFSKPSDTEKAKEYVSKILDEFEQGASVPLTIKLACYSGFLSKKSYQDLTKKYVEDKFEEFSKVIMESLMSFDNQAVPTLGTFAFSLSYKKPDFMRLALQALQEPPSVDSDKSYIQAYANLKAAEYKLEEDKDTIKAKTLLASAKEYYGLLDLDNNEGESHKDYPRKRYLELLMDAGELEDALKFSQYFDDKENQFYCQDMAKLYQMLKDYGKALGYIDKAIGQADDNGYKSSFLWNKANILHDMEDSSCLKVLQDAIGMREEDKAKGEWIETMNKWKK